MIIVTGSAGFIGSHVARFFDMRERMLLVDDPQAFRDNNYFGPHLPTDWDRARAILPDERHKILDYRYFPKILEILTPHYQDSYKEIMSRGDEIHAVVHIGAITDTSKDRSPEELCRWNTEYSKTLWNWCAKHQIPFIYASSAATYGLGESGYSDEHSLVKHLKPLNPYAISKHNFDLWVLEQVERAEAAPPHWYGLKFFNVYGPHEGHKGRMASTILFSYRAIRERGSCPLFRSHRADIKDGEQKRDFIYIDDIVRIIAFILEKRPASGIYNCGTGIARTFMSMAQAVFRALEHPIQIEWIDTPRQFRESYQYFTEAEMSKLHTVGYTTPFLSLEDGVAQYVRWLNKSLAPDAFASTKSN